MNCTLCGTQKGTGEADRHREDKLQDCQTQGRGIDESSACEYEVCESPLARVAHSKPLMTPLVVSARRSTKSAKSISATLQAGAHRQAAGKRLTEWPLRDS